MREMGDGLEGTAVAALGLVNPDEMGSAMSKTQRLAC